MWCGKCFEFEKIVKYGILCSVGYVVVLSCVGVWRWEMVWRRYLFCGCLEFE